VSHIKNKLLSNILVYESGEIELKVSVNNETVWLTQNQLALLFSVTKQNISLHINKIIKENELEEKAVVKDYLTTAKDGKKYKTKHYNLDMIISVGYRVNSLQATKFRQWSTSVLKQYITDGYIINGDKITHERFISLESKVEELSSQLDILTRKELQPTNGIFFNDQVFDAYTFISDLLRTAVKEVVLIDNYVDDVTLTLFSKIPNVKVTIYTYSITKQLKIDFEKYNQQYKNIELKTFKDSHDRFLIIDNKEVYLIGASLKDLGKKWFGFSQIDMKSIETIIKRLK